MQNVIYLITVQHGAETYYTNAMSLSTAKAKARLGKQQTQPRTAIGRVYEVHIENQDWRSGKLVYQTR